MPVRKYSVVFKAFAYIFKCKLKVHKVLFSQDSDKIYDPAKELFLVSFPHKLRALSLINKISCSSSP